MNSWVRHSEQKIKSQKSQFRLQVVLLILIVHWQMLSCRLKLNIFIWISRPTTQHRVSTVTVVVITIVIVLIIFVFVIVIIIIIVCIGIVAFIVVVVVDIISLASLLASLLSSSLSSSFSLLLYRSRYRYQRHCGFHLCPGHRPRAQVIKCVGFFFFFVVLFFLR